MIQANNPIWNAMINCHEGIRCEKHLGLSREIAEKYNLPRFVTKEQFIKAGGVINYGL